MKSKALLLFFVAFLAAMSAHAGAVLKIGGQTITSANPIEGVTVASGSSRATLTLTNCHIQGSDIGIEYSYSQDGVSSPTALPLYIVVNGICTIESTGSFGISSNQDVLVRGNGSLYVKGTVGVNLIGAAAGTMAVADGVELICEGTNGAGIKGLTYQRTKVTLGYYKSVGVMGSATSLIVKGTTQALQDINELTLSDGAAVKYPTGIAFADHALATTEWAHITATGLPINETNFPDQAFRTIVGERYDIHADGYLSRYERSLVTEMNVFQKNIADMTGINYFTNLQSLNCGANNFQSIDISALTKLVNLECYATGLMSINLSAQTMLQTLDIRSNRIASLDVSHNTGLTQLQCEGNFIDSLDVSMCPALVTLSCGGVMPTRTLEWLDVSGCSLLESLNCSNGLLTSLDVSSCTALKRLTCHTNNLEELDVSGLAQLSFVSCYTNQMTTLNAENCTGLQILYCNNNQLDTLNLAGCTALEVLNCSSNPGLTELQVSGLQLNLLDCHNCLSLASIDCSQNQLTSIDVSGCAALTEIRCQRNKLAGEQLDNFIAALPVVTPQAMLYLVDEAEGEENQCTAAQARYIFGKGWCAFHYLDGAWTPILFDEVVIEDGQTVQYLCHLDSDGQPDYAEVIGIVSPTGESLLLADTIGYQLGETEMCFPVTAIAAEAFKDCSGLESVIIPAGVEHIGSQAFGGTCTMSYLAMRSTTPPEAEADAFGDAALGATLVLPGAVRSVYRIRAPWKNFATCVILGDANADGSVSITDVGLMIDHILGNTPGGYHPLMADVNADGTVSITDVGLVIDIILSPGGGFYGSDEGGEIIVSPIGDDDPDDNLVRGRRCLLDASEPE